MSNNYLVQQYPPWAIESFREVHFADFYMAVFDYNPLYTVDYLARKCMSYNPLFIRVLVKIRDIIVSPFGLKTSDSQKSYEVLYFEKGSVLVCFHVWNRDEKTIVLEEKDKHLNFRVLFTVEKNELANELYFKMSTIVHLNNIWGHIYFAPVRPFHRILMRLLFKRFINQIGHSKK